MGFVAAQTAHILSFVMLADSTTPKHPWYARNHSCHLAGPGTGLHTAMWAACWRVLEPYGLFKWRTSCRWARRPPKPRADRPDLPFPDPGAESWLLSGFHLVYNSPRVSTWVIR